MALVSFLGLILYHIIKYIRTKGKRHLAAITYSLVLSLTFTGIVMTNASLPSFSQQVHKKDLTHTFAGRMKLLYELLDHVSPPKAATTYFQPIKKGKTTFYFQFSPNQDILNAYNQGIEVEQKDNQEFFNNVSTGSLTVVFYPNHSLIKKDSGYFVDSYGYFIPKENRLTIELSDTNKTSSNYDNQNTIKMSAHEYNHYLLYQFSREHHIKLSDIPVWLVEGLASYTADRSVGTPLTEERLEGSKLVPFEKLTNPLNWKSYTSNGHYSPYNQSAIFVSYMMNKNGSDTINKLLLKLQNKSFNQAFKDTTGLDFSSYEKQYFKDIHQSLTLWKQVHDLYQKKNSYQAISSLNKIHTLCPQNSLPLLMAAQLYMNEGEYSKATFLAQKADTLNPRDVEQNEFLSRLYMYSNPSKALNEIHKIQLGRPYHRALTRQIELLNSQINRGRADTGFYLYLRWDKATHLTNKIDLINYVLSHYPITDERIVQLKRQYEQQLNL
ncbi:hypothetical protein PU629_12230 [Pullulanibacillus sp. KACC 23026]|uniref:hypothetical protein n=1 Tax=Pullulanibacillus sp. KACC 23026 TaxID=3028315 RepID=UPI0023B18102|nr:hypothetical protein [Pullulanibacillus sp. KACC 23026]WEG10944.1 hypothetical protein PU629_12230 [Pullulanibacillus sp. KACC 23026]